MKLYRLQFTMSEAANCFGGSGGQQFPKLIGSSGTTEVVAIAVDNAGLMALGVQTSDPDIVGTGNNPQVVMLYDPGNQKYNWV